MSATIEPDATLDTRLSNGRFVRIGGVTDIGFVVREGRVQADTDPAEVAWRTVDASAFFVLPALIQPGSPLGQHALAAAAVGVATVIVRSDAPDLDALLRELEHLTAAAQLDFSVVWRVPEIATSADIQRAIASGVTVFELPSIEDARTRLPESADVTVRISAEAFVGVPAAIPSSWRAVAATTDPTEAARFASESLPHYAVELALGESDCDWAALAAHSDRVIVSGGGNLLKSAFSNGVASRGISPIAVAKMTCLNAADAFRLAGRKRGLEPNADADFVVFDPHGAATSAEETPGKVVFSMLRGEILLYNDDLHTAPGSGMRLP